MVARERERRQPAGRRGFTLVEMLTVIAIIGLLAALVVPAVLGAIKTARNGAMKIEVSNIQQSLERYRTEMGEYPPDFSQIGTNDTETVQLKLAAINAHLSRKYRYRNITADAIPPEQLLALNPSNALWFWLRGFSPNEQAPLTGTGDRSAFHEFSDQQLRRDPAFAALLPTLDHVRYYAPAQDSQRAPYLYYKAGQAKTWTRGGDNYAVGEYADADFWSGNAVVTLSNGNQVTAPRPYLTANAGGVRYASYDKFQIICAGLDAQYGIGGQPGGDKRPAELIAANPPTLAQGGGGIFPEGPYSSMDLDNICSFTQEATLEDSQP